MQCDKNVTPHPRDQMPFECESTRPGADLDDDDAPDVPDDGDVAEEAGYGYGV
jgi:hypothetical protein